MAIKRFLPLIFTSLVLVMLSVVFALTNIFSLTSMSPFTSNMLFVILHCIVIITATYLAIFLRSKLPMFGKIFLILLTACCLHHVIFWIDAGKILFELAMMCLLAPYTVFVFLGGIFGSVYLSQARKAKIAETRTDAIAFIEKAKDTQTRYKDGAHLTYKMQLTYQDRGSP